MSFQTFSSHRNSYCTHFPSFLAFYPILKELRQLHFHDKNTHRPAVEQVLKEVSPPSDESIKYVAKQLTISLHKYKAHLHQEIPQQPEQEYCESCVLEAELSTSCQSDIPGTHSATSQVVNSDCALSDFIKC